MKQFLAFIQKEIYHILRDPKTLLVVLGMPIVQILVFGFALSNEVKNTRIAILDHAKDIKSIQLIDRFNASKYFEIYEILENPAGIDESLRSGNTQMVLIIPANFHTDLNHENKSKVQIITDGINPNLATSLINYSSAIIRDFEMDLLLIQPEIPLQIKIQTRMLYNPQLKGEYTYVPGVIALVLMLICTMMTAVSIVKEKEMGNMEILLVSPINPLSIIFSKAIPYFILSLIILSVVLLLSATLLGVPILGSLILLYVVSMVFILASLALGLLISSVAKTQQVAMLISLIGLMVPTMMLSGFMFPIESMPKILQVISNAVPAKWYFFSLQSIMIKGSGISSITKEFMILSGFAIFFLAISIKKFKIRLS